MRHLSSFGTSRLHVPSGTAKIEQLIDSPSYRRVKALLRSLRRVGLLTLDKQKKNLLILKWEPRVFPEEEIKPAAEQTLERITHTLTLAFKNQAEREKFMRWLNRRKLLV